jgi:hypothetical protein
VIDNSLCFRQGTWKKSVHTSGFKIKSTLSFPDSLANFSLTSSLLLDPVDVAEAADEDEEGLDGVDIFR